MRTVFDEPPAADTSRAEDTSKCGHQLLPCSSVKKYNVGQITGLNITAMQVERARQRVRERGLEHRITLGVGSATSVPFDNESSGRHGYYGHWDRVMSTRTPLDSQCFLSASVLVCCACADEATADPRKMVEQPVMNMAAALTDRSSTRRPRDANEVMGQRAITTDQPDASQNIARTAMPTRARTRLRLPNRAHPRRAASARRLQHKAGARP